MKNLLPTSHRAGTAGLREPRGTVGIEVPQEESVILGGEEIVEGGGEIGRAGGDWWDVYIEDG